MEVEEEAEVVEMVAVIVIEIDHVVVIILNLSIEMIDSIFVYPLLHRVYFEILEQDMVAEIVNSG